MKAYIKISLFLWPVFFLIGIMNMPKIDEYGFSIARTKSDLSAITQALHIYREKHSVFPSNSAGLRALVDSELLKKIPIDIWNNEYKYVTSDKHTEFETYSFGPNGRDDNGLHDDVFLTMSNYDCNLFDDCMSFSHKIGRLSWILFVGVIVSWISIFLFYSVKWAWQKMLTSHLWTPPALQARTECF